MSQLLKLFDEIFSPRQFFTNGEQGIWLDPSDFSTLFQDAAGTTPVTALGQPVGLALDKRLGLVLGSEIVTQPVDLTSGWTTTGSPVVTTNSFTTASTGGVTFPYAASEGEFYECVATIGNDTTVNLFVPTNTATIVAGALREVRFFIRIGSGGSAGFYFRNSGAGTTTITNLSIRRLPGNHAYQTTAASRPTVEARVNLLTRTEEFDHANWTRSGASVVGNATTAPDGTLTADKIVEDVATSGHFVTQVGSGRRCRIRAKAAERNWLLVYSGVAGSNVYVNLTTGAYTTSPDVTSVSTTSLGNDWWLVDIVWNTLSTTPRFYGTTGSGVSSWTGDGVSGIYVWGAELIYGATDNYPYQKVNTATDYVDIGAPRYLQFDGTDDGMATPSINFTGTDKMTVWAGVRKNSDAASAVVAELSAAVSVNIGAFNLQAPRSGASYGIGVRGTGLNAGDYSTFTAPISTVISASLTTAGSNLGNTIAARFNGVSNAGVANSNSVTTGNFGTYPLYIGRRGGTTLPFNGRIYGLIVRGAESNAGQIAAGEAWCNSKARAY